MSNTFDDESPIKEDLEPLIIVLKTDPDWNKRFGAASKLFRLGKEKAIDPLIHALQNDSHNEIRRFACDLLGKLGDPRATWALIATLRQGLIDKDNVIVHHATEALLLLRVGDLSGILISTVTDTEEFFEMRIKSLELLGKIADNESVEGLISIIKNPDTDGKIRGKAIEELIYTGHLAGLQMILEQLEKTRRKDFKKIVVRALGKTPFKNKTIVFRIGEILLTISEQEEKKSKKDSDLLFYIAEALKNLANNIGYEFSDFMDELIKLRNKQKSK
ncbi:MAG TPA: HEAT repeat domain-containing protein [candidate division Zixibacteria bacterium]|nr:HEAT repeat domain-containing protein [candidate division Zixibacteria bacterium]